MRYPAILVAAVVSIVTVTGCSNNDTDSAVDASKPYNDADVAFATDMIQHHAQALEMVDLTLGRDLDPRVAAVADQIRTAQAPEIEQMVDLLNAWDRQPIPATSRDHSNAHNDDKVEMDTTMPGMMSHDDLEALETAEGSEFEKLWLDMMMAHHQGAIEMASVEAESGEDKTATTLAEDIVRSQTAQVNIMKRLGG